MTKVRPFWVDGVLEGRAMFATASGNFVTCRTLSSRKKL